MDLQEMNIKFISSIIHVQKCKIMYSCAPFFKAYFYQRFIQFTMHHLIHLVQNVQLCTFMHSGETLCYFRVIFRSLVHNSELKDFLMLPCDKIYLRVRSSPFLALADYFLTLWCMYHGCCPVHCFLYFLPISI